MRIKTYAVCIVKGVIAVYSEFERAGGGNATSYSLLDIIPVSFFLV